MDISLLGKHALVCGASKGIGRASAIALAELGANVTVLARTQNALETLVKELPKPHPSQAHDFIAADAADSATLSAKVAALCNANPVQILINNSGGPPGGPAHSANAAAFLDAFQKHLLANHSLVQTVLPGMQTSGYGRIINIISTSVKEPLKGLGVSNTIRGAVASWAKTLAGELGVHGITVNNVLPGFTRTQRLDEIIADKQAKTGQSEEALIAAMRGNVPLGRFAEAHEIANAVAFLASPAASYISGINLPVDGGRTLSL